jgi:hypothetical protein
MQTHKRRRPGTWRTAIVRPRYLVTLASEYDSYTRPMYNVERVTGPPGSASAFE